MNLVTWQYVGEQTGQPLNATYLDAEHGHLKDGEQ